MDKRLILYINDELKTEIELLSFEFNAKRMAGTPTINATLKWVKPLKIDTKCYTFFQGEKYYVKQTPSCTKENTDARYKYEISFVSERDILDNIYFYNATTGPSDKLAHDTTFKWCGNVRDYIRKLNASLRYSLGDNDDSYQIQEDGLDGFDTSIEKFISFEDVYFSSALQEIYNVFEIPYYFSVVEIENENGEKIKKRTIDIGFCSTSVNEDNAVRYGKGDALLSVEKVNANFKVVNKCTAIGSSENLPIYYPNETATGKHEAVPSDGISLQKDYPVNYDYLGKHLNLLNTVELVFHKKPEKNLEDYKWVYYPGSRQTGGTGTVEKEGATFPTSTVKFTTKAGSEGKCSSSILLLFTALSEEKVKLVISLSCQTKGDDASVNVVSQEDISVKLDSVKCNGVETEATFDGSILSFEGAKSEEQQYIDVEVKLNVVVTDESFDNPQLIYPINVSAYVNSLRRVYRDDYFTYSDDINDYIYVSESGVNVTYDIDEFSGEKTYNAEEGSTVTIKPVGSLLPVKQYLMPPIYRGTLGYERFYKAINGGYTLKDDDETYSYTVEYKDDNENDIEFKNPYSVDGRNYNEHSFVVEDLKPTIKGAVYNKEVIDVIADVAFDLNDNNEFDEDNKLQHEFFYVKLKPLGFNLFQHASEKGEMIMSFTSGDCAACDFTIAVNEYNQNTLQVSDGDVLLGEDGKAVFGAPQALQNDTTNNSVWVALMKQDSTYGFVIPKDPIRPKPNDNFVFLNINLPHFYIENAENVLEEKIKEYLVNNNNEKFKFSIKFSRIFLAQNEDFRESLDENSRILVSYKDDDEETEKEVWLYVDSFNYKMTEGQALPEISVSLTDTISTPKVPLQNVIDKVKAEVNSSIESIDVVAQGARAFLRKDTDDQTFHSLTASELTSLGDSIVHGSSEVKKDLKVLENVEVDGNINLKGDFTCGEYMDIHGEVSGAKIDQHGNAKFKSLKANSLEISTLQYNEIRASSLYTSFDDTATIVDVMRTPEGKYVLTFDDTEFKVKDSFGVGVQPFYEGDILWGKVNKINNYDYSTYGECWLYVSQLPDVKEDGSLNEPSENKLGPNQVVVEMYANDAVPEGINIEPQRNMVVTHRGNGKQKIDKIGGKEVAIPAFPERQSTFYISSRDKNIVQLLDVDKPKLYKANETDEDGKHYSNYGIVAGVLPDDLYKYLTESGVHYLDANHPYLYARGILAQDFTQIDYLGRPIRTERYRGEWSIDVAKSDDPYRSFNNTETSIFDTVTHNGSKWMCYSDKTLEEPTENLEAGEGVAWKIMVRGGDTIFFADLSNEFDSVGTTKDGYTDAEYHIETVVSMFYGAIELDIEDIEVVSPHENIEVTVERKEGYPTGKISFYVPKDVYIDERNQYEIVVKYYGKEEKRISFTIAGIRAGEDGKTATLYRIIPSTNELIKSENGTIRPENVTIDVAKMEGGDAKDLTDDDRAHLYVYYSKDGQESVLLPFGDVNISTQDVIEFINVKLIYANFSEDGIVDLDNSPLVDYEKIHVFKDGESPIVIDLDNDTDAIVVGADGKTIKSESITTNVRIFKGGKECRLKEIYTPNIDSDIWKVEKPTFEEEGEELYTGELIFSVGKGVKVESRYSINIVATTEDDETRNIVLTIICVNGSSNAPLYKLDLSTKEVVQYKDDEGFSHDNVKVSCVKTIGGVEGTASEGDVKYEYTYKDASNLEYNCETYETSFTVVTTVFRTMTIKLYGKDENDEYRFYDSETVSVVKDANSTVSYSITTNPADIVISDNGANVESINVKVVRNIGERNDEIYDSNTLSKYGYEMFMSIDNGVWNALELVNNGEETYTFDDGSTLELSNGILINVEKTVVDLTSVDKQINFGLRKIGASGDPIYSASVFVSRNTNTPELKLDIDTITINTQKKDDEIIISKDSTSDITLELFIGQGVINTSDYEVTINKQNEKPQCDKFDLNNKYKLSIYFYEGEIFDNYSKEISVTATYNNQQYTKKISISESRKGDTGGQGKQGDAGPFIYPAGELIAGKNYGGEQISGATIAKPMYIYNGGYYVLEYSGEESFKFDPKEHLHDVSYFRPLADLKYVFAEILMAEWAKLASAVFFRDYMFSELGRASGSDELKSYVAEMFDEDGHWLPDKFTPNFMLDMNSGKLIANDAEIRGQIHATSGTFEGAIKATSGTMQDVTATNLTVDSGAFSGEITANSGSIGGFSINYSSLGTRDNGKMYLDDEVLQFTSADGSYCAFGYGGLPSASGGSVKSAAVINTTDTNTNGTNIGLKISAKNGGRNYAISADSPIKTTSWNVGCSCTFISAGSSGVALCQYTHANPFMYVVTYSTGGGVILPTLTSILNTLGTNEGFAVRLTVIASSSSQKGAISHRGVSGNQSHPYVIDPSDGSTVRSHIEQSAGDISEFILTYDKSNYIAYWVTRRM